MPAKQYLINKNVTDDDISNECGAADCTTVSWSFRKS